MNSKRYILAALLIMTALAGSFLWRACTSAAPSIRFVEIRTNRYGHVVAVFRATNESDMPFSYWGYGPMTPFYYRRAASAAGWQRETVYDCGTGACLNELAPHATLDFEAEPSYVSTKFAVGVYFARGTPKELYIRQRNTFTEWRDFVLHFLPEPEPTWSEVIRFPGPEPNPMPEFE